MWRFVLFFILTLSAEDHFRDHILFSPEGPHTIGYIKIDDKKAGINQGTWIYVKNALDHYKKTKPIFVILELNTPGGEVFAAQKISDALKDLDTQASIPVVTFINNWAISAGAMLAYSTRYITVVKDGAMGAAEPVIQGPSGEMQSASEKVNSALRADFSNRAAFYDRNRLIAEAMVDKDIILVERAGKILKLDNENQVQTGDTIITPKGKLLTLDAEQMVKYRVADAMLPPAKLEPITEEEESRGQWPASKMLLFTQPFFKEIPHAVIDSYQVDWKTRLLMFLALPAVASVLFMGLMVGAYIEFNTPGFGVPGTVALTCFVLILMSSFALEIANWFELILLLTGAAFILIEVMVIPTAGLLAVIGGLFFILGLFGLMLPGLDAVQYDFDTQSWNAAGQAFLERLVWLVGAILVGFALIIGMARFLLPSFSRYQRLVLHGNEQEGFIAGLSPEFLPKVGEVGEALSTLRPAGKVLIQDQIYDAISSGQLIEKGDKVVVIRLEGSVIVVR